MTDFRALSAVDVCRKTAEYYNDIMTDFVNCQCSEDNLMRNNTNVEHFTIWNDMLYVLLLNVQASI